ncbi:demethylspheroidene O-methyltransferase [Sphingomonas kaistensis]|uniref:Demethylspheroidene O-methyltransferase n=1 Tax=Sphingomonas kaistensis TaxID=298708 RepID=A0A7X5Y5G6_9SPHN|nr:demethylspheroidene O-methyltransferase [Sphingomonas kaistensis]
MLDRQRPLPAARSHPGLALVEWRNRLIASPRFQALAQRLLPGRWIARAHARRLFDLTAGFVYSQVTAAFVESGLLDALAAAPLTGEEAAAAARLTEDAVTTLLLAAASLGLAQRIGDRWTLGVRGAALLATPGLGAMIRHHRLLYADLADPLAMLRRSGGGALARLWDYAPGSQPADAATYSELMAATQPMVAAQALAAYPFACHQRLLDIGGGSGAFLRAVGERAPGLELGLFERPEVLAATTASPGIARHGGDFRHDPLPGGYDLHTLVRVLHDHDDGAALAILKASRAALAPGGRLLIVEPMAALGSAPEGHAYFGMYLAAMRSGRPRDPGEISAMLQAAGFARVQPRTTPLPLVASCLVAFT